MPKSNHIPDIPDQYHHNRDIVFASSQQQQSHQYNTKQALTNICYVNDNSSTVTTTTTTTAAAAATTTTTVTKTATTLTKKQTPDTNRHSISNTNSNTKNVAANSSGNSGGTGTGNSSSIIGHYELKKTLGKGNFSTVKLAQHRITQHLVAIKVVKTTQLSEDNLMKLNREIDVLKRLGKHENVVRLYQVIKTRRYFMLVTEYCANGELYDYLVKHGKLSEANSCKYFLQILSAIEYLHDHNVVHRDLKAENLLLTNDLKTIKIVDFGFANYYKPDNLLSTWCGSPPYAAPELFKGLEYVGPPVDIWSMGVVLYVMVCGSLPFDGHNLVYLKSRVLSGKFRIPYFMSTECEGLIRGMLRLDPDRRFCIRQIRSHCWTAKYINARKENATEVINQQVVYMDSTTSNINQFSNKNLSSLRCSTKSPDNKNNDGNNNRGLSLDFEDDKRKSTDTSIEDSVMTCLSSNDEKKISATKQRNLSTSIKPALTKNFVDTDIANAVSNMSLDSNTSAMSVSQSIDTTSTLSNQGSITANIEKHKSGPQKADHSVSGYQGFSKENSIDDQIIDFMIGNLKVADSQSLIRQSIADDKYDDLHAIYRLLKDEPKIVLEALSSARFKIPSLPLISLSKQQSSKKPSITTGFFNPPVNNQSKPVEIPQATDMASNFGSNGFTDFNGSDDKKLITLSLAMNLVTNTEFDSQKVPKPRDRERRSEDIQSWTIPPQLFLTPPSENRYSTLKTEESARTIPNESDSPTISAPFNREIKQVVARHSFDSTIQNFAELSNISGSPNNKLTLNHSSKQWDSSILDSLGVSTPPLNMNQNLLMRPNDNSDQSFSSMHGDPKEALQIVNNIAGITSNLPQIGTQSSNQSTTNQDLLLAQLNSLPNTAAVTQSSMLSQWQTNEQRFLASNMIKFTPNNLLNQNHNVMNNLAMPNNLINTGIPNLCLLDPSGLISGLERRASDGQASYSSLTSNVKVNDTSTLAHKICNENKTIAGPITPAAAATFLSSSSKQLSSSLQNTQPGHCYMPLNMNPQSPSLDNDQQQSISNNSMIMNHVNAQHPILTQVDRRNTVQGTEQTDPLDLTKGSREVKQQQDKARLSFGGETYSQLSSRQQNKQSSQQRSHSTTSASVLFQNSPTSATTSPRSSLFISNTMANNVQLPYCQVSPSSISLTGGGPGHLSTRRKRHSLENETRGLPHKNQTPGHYQQYPTSQHKANFHLFNKSNESSRSLRQNPAQQHLQYPMSSHIGQLRNFAQTFSYKKLMKKQESERGREPPIFTPYSQQTEYTSMDFNNNNRDLDNEDIDK